MLDSRQDRPLYRQLTDELRRQIAQRKPGERIASEPELAMSLGVSRFTVAKAVETLVEEGLVVRRQGKGTFVTVPPLQRTPIHMRSFTESVEAAGHKASSQLLSFGPMPWREGLPYAQGEALIGLERLRLVDSIPMAIHRSILSAALAKEVGLTRIKASDPRFSLYQYYEQQGLRVERGVETLAARRPAPSERRQLRMRTDGIVIVVTRRSLGADGRVLDVVDAVHDSTRYSYQALLQRSSASPGDAATHMQPQEASNVEVDSGDKHLGTGLWLGHRGTDGAGGR